MLQIYLHLIELLYREIWKAARLISACWFSVCCTHFLHDLPTQIETSSFFLSPPLQFAVFTIAPALRRHGAVPTRLCSTAPFYFGRGWRTPERHHLVTRRLFQMALQGSLDCTMVAFGSSPANACPHLLIHRQADKDKTCWWNVLRCTTALLNLGCTSMLCVLTSAA